MANRPHSRQERVSEGSGSVGKQSFDSYGSSSRGTSSRSGASTAIGIAALAATLLKKKKQQQSYTNTSINYPGTTRRKSLLSRIIKLVIIVVVIMFIFRFVSGLFNSVSIPDNNYNNNTNNTEQVVHLGNNNNYDLNTSSNDVNLNVTSGARNKYTKILGNKKDEVTVMVYMIGTDLESGYGAATKDINEMLYADLNDNINIVIQTGGCNKWNNTVVSNRTCQRYTVNSDGFYILQDNLGDLSMVDPNTLSSFIRYSADNFPANRYMLILWDHGGGSVTGYGYDERHPYDGSMSPDLIGKALKDGGIKFDVVGFDACLMANLETAIAIEPYADYLIGSEETEPGNGWYYTNWLTELDDNTSIETVKLGKTIIDDYVSSSLSDNRTAEVTQSITDLGELVYNVKSPLITFSKSVKEKLEGDDYQQIANARYNTKEFSRSANLDQVDLIDLCDNFNVKGSEQLIEAIKSAVKYNKTANIADSYGLSAYFPYSSLSKMNEMVKIYDNINMDESYTSVIKSFASIASSGQIATHASGSSSTSLFDILMGNSYSGSSYSQSDLLSLLTDSYSYSNYYDPYSYSSIFGSGYDSWFDYRSLNNISSYLSRGNLLDSNELNVIEKGGQRVVSLSESQWELIDNVLLNMFIDDGEGYIDLGRDNLFRFNDDGDLIVESDGTWLTLNNHFVSYYMVSDMYIDDNNYKTVGKIPAYLNGQRVDIMVNFTPEDPYGKIIGASLIYEDSDTKQKGLIDIVDGDVIKFVCEYYTYDGQFVDEYQLGETMIVRGDLELYNKHIDNKCIYAYCFEDIYGNNLWTPKTDLN